MSKESLSSLQSLDTFLETDEGRALYPSRPSLDWFIRENRVELIDLGSLVKVRGQWHVIRPLFDQAVLRILRDRAKRIPALAAPGAE